MFANVKCLRTRWEMEAVSMPVLEGQSQIDLFSTRGHHSTWEPIQAASHGSDCAERLLAEENILLPCGHTGDLLHEGWWQKGVDVSEEKNNEEGGMDWL